MRRILEKLRRTLRPSFRVRNMKGDLEHLAIIEFEHLDQRTEKEIADYFAKHGITYVPHEPTIADLTEGLPEDKKEAARKELERRGIK
jgi:hypothetical protein